MQLRSLAPLSARTLRPGGAPHPSAAHITMRYALAFFPWGVLAPLNLVKLMLNKVSPTAHFWVPKETEQCQAACGIARMWATLFWSMQFVWALAYLYVHANREQVGLIYFGAATKLIVGSLLLNAYVSGVILWPIGVGGALLEWLFALLFLSDMRARRAADKQA